MISTFRIPVEHAFAHLQRFKLLAGIYRGDHSIYDDTFLTIAGLHNFRRLNRLALVTKVTEKENMRLSKQNCSKGYFADDLICPTCSSRHH